MHKGHPRNKGRQKGFISPPCHRHGHLLLERGLAAPCTQKALQLFHGGIVEDFVKALLKPLSVIQNLKPGQPGAEQHVAHVMLFRAHYGK